jgi:hypothetical protein
MSHQGRMQEIDNLERAIAKRIRRLLEVKARYGIEDLDLIEPIAFEPTRTATREVVTDHAVVRFLERVHGISIDRIRGIILNEKRKAMIAAGATAIKCGDYTCVISEGRVVTITAKPKK